MTADDQARALRAVLFSTPVGILGGAERALLDLIRSLREAAPGLRIEVVLGADGPLRGALQDEGVPVSLVPYPAALLGAGERGFRRTRDGLLAGPAAAAYLAGLRAHVRERRPDLVHTNGMKAHVLTTIACAGLAPVVWHVRDFVGARGLARRVLRPLARLASGAVAVSRAVGDDLAAYVPGLRVRVVHDAIDPARFGPGPGDGRWLDEAAGLPRLDDAVRVGLVATFARWKGHRTFLEAAARVAAPARFFVVGGPVYATRGSQVDRDELEGWCRELGVADRVGVVGFQQDPAAVYRALDVVVHASTEPEPFGLTIVEAMACGRAVIATSAAGCVELIDAGEHVLTVPPGDAAALARAIEDLVGDPARRRALGARAAARAREAFDARRLGPDVASAWADFVKEGARA